MKQEHVINGLLPCLSEIIAKRMIKNTEVVRQFNKVIVECFMKFRDLIMPTPSERDIIANFMNILSLSNLIGNFINQEQ